MKEKRLFKEFFTICLHFSVSQFYYFNVVWKVFCYQMDILVAKSEGR